MVGFEATAAREQGGGAYAKAGLAPILYFERTKRLLESLFRFQCQSVGTVAKVKNFLCALVEVSGDVVSYYGDRQSLKVTNFDVVNDVTVFRTCHHCFRLP